MAVQEKQLQEALTARKRQKPKSRNWKAKTGIRRVRNPMYRTTTIERASSAKIP
jgi:hypothetical protein